MILPIDSSTSLIQALEKGTEGFDMVSKSLSAVSVADSEAYFESDATRIKSLIRSSVGYAAVEEAARCRGAGTTASAAGRARGRWAARARAVKRERC